MVQVGLYLFNSRRLKCGFPGSRAISHLQAMQAKRGDKQTARAVAGGTDIGTPAAGPVANQMSAAWFR